MAKWRLLPGFDRRRKVRSARELELSRKLRAATGLFWALCGGIVIAFLIFTMLGSIQPSEDAGATAVALTAAILWLGHAVLVLYRSTPLAPDEDTEEHTVQRTR